MCSAFALGFACNRTDNPREVYTPLSGVGGAVSRGGATSSSGGIVAALGGAPSTAERGGSTSVVEAGASGHGSSTEGGAPPIEAGGAGGESPEAGSGGDGVVEPPIDVCGPPPVTTSAFSRENLRGAAADCAIWHYCQFEQAATQLSQSTRSHDDAPSAATLLTAQNAFRAAMARWSRVELFQFGPLASNSMTAGKDMTYGQGLRDLIFSWPTSARCRVEEQLANRNFATRGMQGVLISARGLFALEYDLFYAGSDTACLEGSAAANTFAQLSAEDVAARKREYAAALASDVVTQIGVVLQKWRADGGNFRQTFVSAAGYPTEQESLNVLGYALVYAERELKDYKLGVPLGRIATSPVTVGESPFANLGTENIRENLRGFRALFEGCGEDGAGLGFDDWLNAVGHPELAEEILSAYRNAQAAADAFPPFNEASAEQLDALFVAVKALTDLLKADLLSVGSVLGLKLPAGVEGDTD